MLNFNYLMDLILYQIFKIFFDYIIKKHKALTDNPLIRIYISISENRITLKVESRCHLELLITETMELL